MAQQLTDRDNRILRHIGRYRLTVRPILEKLYFRKDQSSNDVIRRLAELELLDKGKLPGGFSYYSLTEKGTQAASFADGMSIPRARSNVHGRVAVHLAVLWFCSMTKKRRVLVENRRLLPRLGEPFPDADHCLQEIEGKFRLLRVYVPESQTEPRAAARYFAEHIYRKALQNVTVARWIKSRHYGFAILSDNEARSAALKKQFGDPRRIPQKDCYTMFALAPQPDTLGAFLKEDSDAREN